MAFRKVDGGGAGENVFVDDRCPTIWQAPRFSSSPQGATEPPLEPRRNSKLVQAAQNERDVALYTTKPKSIDGNLLRRLHQATVEEKLRTSQNLVKQKRSDEVPWKKEVKSAEPPGFYIPPDVGTPRPRLQETPTAKPKEIPQKAPPLPSPAIKPIAKKEKPKKPPKATRPQTSPEVKQTTKTNKSIPATPAQSVKSVISTPATPALSVESVKSDSTRTSLVRITGSHGQETFVELPLLQPSLESRPAPASITAAEPEPDIADIAEEPSGKMNKKNNRKNKKALKREAKAKQAAISPELDLANDEQAKGGPNDGDALMSGALPATNALASDSPEPHATISNDGFQAIIENSSSSHTLSKKDRATMQPTVESVASQRSSRTSGQPKATSIRTPSVRTSSTKVSSLRSFIEVGDAWVGQAGLQAGSEHSDKPHTSSKAPSEQDFEDLGQQWIEPDEPLQISKNYMSNFVPSSHSARRSSHSSPRGLSQPAFVEDEEASSKSHSHTPGTNSVYKSDRSGSHRTSIHSLHRLGSHHSSARTSQSIRSDSAKTQSRKSSFRHSSVSKSSSRDLRLSNSPKGIQASYLSPRSLISRLDKIPQPNQHGSFAGDRQPHRSHADSDEDQVNIRGGTYEPLSAHTSQRTSEGGSKVSRDFVQTSQSSQRSHRGSRHASTRSFSPREDVWEGPPSIRSSAISGSRPPSSQHLEPAFQHSANKRSVVTSVIGSVASLISRVRSELTFEQVGEGWHGGDSPSNEPTQYSQKAHSSNRTSSQLLQPLDEDDNSAGDWEPVERSESRQSRSNTHSRNTSISSTRRSLPMSRHTHPHSSKSRSSASHRSDSETRVRSLVGTPIHAIVSSTGQRVAVVDAPEIHTEKYGKPRKQRPTVFAGTGWITPHPLESSIVERTPAIVLPSNARPNGVTLSYEKWKAMQEDGLREHRNFSTTESNQSERERHKDDRYRFSGWEARSWDEVEPASRDPNIASTRRTSRKAPAVRSTDSQPVKERSSLGSLQDSMHSHSRHSQRSNHRKVPTVSSSERLWERMEEGDVGRSQREDSVVSDKSGQAYSEWNHSGSRGSRSVSRHR